MANNVITREQSLAIRRELSDILSSHYRLREITPDTETRARQALVEVANKIKDIPVFNSKGAGTSFAQSGSYLEHLEFIYFALLRRRYSDACNETDKYLYCHLITERRNRDALLALFEKFNII